MSEKLAVKVLTKKEVLGILKKDSNIVHNVTKWVSEYEAKHNESFGEILFDRTYEHQGSMAYTYSYVYHFVAHDVYIKQQYNFVVEF